MSSEPHPCFPVPSDPSALVWRYMDLSKMLSMIQRNALYFRRIDQFEDKYEGVVTQAMFDNIGQYAGKMADAEEVRAKERGSDKFDRGKYHETMVEFFKKQFSSSNDFRKIMYANCWHMNEEESSAMWRLYTSHSDSIAVCSTFNKLSEVLPSSTSLGTVTYVDYRNAVIPIDNVFYQAMHKRKSFAHENEVRAIYADFNGLISGEQCKEIDGIHRDDDHGIYISCDIKSLIDRVYVSPSSSREFKVVVGRALRTYGFEVPILQSDVNAPPAY